LAYLHKGEPFVDNSDMFSQARCLHQHTEGNSKYRRQPAIVTDWTSVAANQR